MVNILLDAAHWNDSLYGRPPSYWNGTTYDYIGNVPSGKYFLGATMNYVGTVHAADTISGTIQSTSADPTEFAVIVNGTPVYSQTLMTGVLYTFSHTFAGGEAVEVTLGVGDSLYSQDAILNPSATIPTVYSVPNEMILTWSDDGGHNWAPEIRQSMGNIGQTSQRVKFNRLGSTRRNTGLDRVFEISSESFMQVCLVGASINED